MFKIRRPPRHYSGLAKPIGVAPLYLVTDRPALSAKLLSGDPVLLRYASISMFSDFSRQRDNREILYTQANDADLANVIAAAGTYGTKLSYNVEGLTGPEILTKMQDNWTNCHAAGYWGDITFGTTYDKFIIAYGNYQPYCKRQIIQLQRCHIGEEASLTDDGISKVESVNGSYPYVQICCYTPNYWSETITAADVVAACRALENKRIAGIFLYFANAGNEALMLDVVNQLRP